MDLEKAQNISNIVGQIIELSMYKNILENQGQYKVAHFQFVKDYGDNPDKVCFQPKYTQRFINVVEQIIMDLKNELSEL